MSYGSGTDESVSGGQNGMGDLNGEMRLRDVATGDHVQVAGHLGHGWTPNNLVAFRGLRFQAEFGVG